MGHIYRLPRLEPEIASDTHDAHIMKKTSDSKYSSVLGFQKTNNKSSQFIYNFPTTKHTVIKITRKLYAFLIKKQYLKRSNYANRRKRMRQVIMVL